MTVAASGALRTAALVAEYGGATTRRLSHYRRGAAQGWVKANAGNNSTTNLSAAVPTSGPMRLSNFRGQAKGWTYTNYTTRVPSPSHYHCHVEYGDDWNTNWPCFYINNAQMGSDSTNYYALVIYGRANGPFTFTNNSFIDGAGGVSSGQGGQHAVYIYNTVAGANRPILINGGSGQIRGGGGAGGTGGTGGTGSNGTYYTYEPGPTNAEKSYSRDHITWRIGSDNSYVLVWYGTVVLSQVGFVASPATIGGWNYYRGTLQETYVGGPNNYNGNSISRNYQNETSPGGTGGAGGAGGRGVGYNQTNAAGANGAAGNAGAAYTGVGGQGGTGGGGTITRGTAGSTGGTGSIGGVGPNGYVTGGPTPGSVGSAGGPGGYAVYAATPFGWTNNGTIAGSVGGGVAPS